MYITSTRAYIMVVVDFVAVRSTLPHRQPGATRQRSLRFYLRPERGEQTFRRRARIPAVHERIAAQMGKRILVLIGTKKGTFIAESDEARADWQIRGPLCGAPMQFDDFS